MSNGVLNFKWSPCLNLFEKKSTAILSSKKQTPNSQRACITLWRHLPFRYISLLFLLCIPHSDSASVPGICTSRGVWLDASCTGIGEYPCSSCRESREQVLCHRCVFGGGWRQMDLNELSMCATFRPSWLRLGPWLRKDNNYTFC